MLRRWVLEVGDEREKSNDVESNWFTMKGHTFYADNKKAKVMYGGGVEQQKQWKINFPELYLNLL